MLAAFLQFHLCQTQADRMERGEEVILIGSSYIGLQTLKNHCGERQSDDISDSFSVNWRYQMTKMVKKRFDAPDETRPIAKGKVEVVKLDDIQVMRATFEPGWRWSESVKPIVKTDSCQVHHISYIISGRMAVRMDDGSTAEFGPGDVGIIPPGHDAWIVGDVPCVSLDFGGAATYAKPPS